MALGVSRSPINAKFSERFSVYGVDFSWPIADNKSMKNPVIDIQPTNSTLPNEWRGVRYTFQNGWSLSVILTKRGDTHECALMKPDGEFAYTSDWKDLLFLTSQQVVRLVDYIQQNEDDTLQRVRAWLIFEGELAKIKS